MGMFGRILLGIVLAALAQVLGLFLAGAGHGWSTAFFASFALWLFLPLTFAIVSARFGSPSSRLVALIALIGAGVATDAYLIMSTCREGAQYFEASLRKNLPLTLAWLALWCSWQLMAVRNLFVGHSRHEPAND